MKTKKMVMAALMAALACIMTMIIKVPSPLKGYVNLGDCIVLVAGWMFSPTYGVLAAGIGSAMADVFSGYLLYAPATFVIKGLMALTAYYGYKLCSKKIGDLPTVTRPGYAFIGWYTDPEENEGVRRGAEYNYVYYYPKSSETLYALPQPTTSSARRYAI